MIIFINNDSKVFVYNTKYLEKIESLGEYLTNKFKTKRENFWLSYGGKVLLDNFFIDDLLTPNSTIYLNWRPLNVVKVISGSNIYFLDYHMIYNYKKFSFRRFVKNKDKMSEFNISEKYLNNLIFDNWFEIYKYSRSINNINFNKASDKKYIKNIAKNYFFTILNKKNISELSDLSILFDHIDNKFYFNLVNCFISMRYLTNRKPEDIIKLKLFEKN
jgi:hypothetical protein